MAQQLASLRSAPAYAGVTKYAHDHKGEASAAAYLALGHAYLLDHRYPEAAESFHQARQAGDALADYADYLGAQANHEAGNHAAAEALLRGFNTRYPDSIFYLLAPELEANALLAMNDAPSAEKILSAESEGSDRPGRELAQAQIALALGHTDEAGKLFHHLLLSHPLTSEAQTARAKLIAMGAESTLTNAELRSLGDAYYNAGHYEDAADQYHALMRSADAASRGGFAVAAAACIIPARDQCPESTSAPRTVPGERSRCGP